MDEIEFEDGTLQSKGYFMNGDTKVEVEEPVYTGNTPLSAVMLNKLQKNIKPHKFHVELQSDIASGDLIELPAYYKVGTNCLDVYYMGELLKKSSDSAGTDGHYIEVGTDGTLSKNVRITQDWTAEKYEYFDFVIRGEYNA